MSSVESIKVPVLNVYDSDKVVEAISQTVKSIGIAILKDRIPFFLTPMTTYLERFESKTFLSVCDGRTQMLFHKIVAAVKEEMGKNSFMKGVVELSDEAPFYLHYVLQPVKDLITQLDKTQPGSVDDLIKPSKVDGPRVSLKDLVILENAIHSGQSGGLLLISHERLNDLKLDRDDLLVNHQLSDDQKALLNRLSALITECENYAK